MQRLSLAEKIADIEPMKNIRFSWPDGKRGALTSSWDDGTEYDRRLIAIFNEHGIKGSFYLNSGALGKTAAQSGWKNYVTADEVATLYRGQEVGSHTVTHPHLWQIPGATLRWEFTEDRRRLEALVGYPMRGAVMPFGWESGLDIMADQLGGLGFRYVRRTQLTDRFEHPADFLRWRPTAHCSADLSALWARYVVELARLPGTLLNLWGHSYEFEERQEWAKVEAWARAVGATAGVWHATQGEVYDYLTAWRSLAWSVAGDVVYNTSATTVFFSYDTKLLSVAPGQTLACGQG